MEEASEVMEDIVFRGVEFSVKIQVDKSSLTVEISDLTTADQWKGEFEPVYIEDLTRKTGNFKQFAIFCSMLESAIRKTSDSVTLDLLTYADLELLRNRKVGEASRSSGQQQPSALAARRYLILIYTVEFDRVHYPLPLPYVGKPDPAALQKEIRALKAALGALTTHGVNKSAEVETLHLRAELVRLKQEKEAMAKVLQQLEMNASASTAGHKVWMVKDVVRTLEEQFVKEKAKFQRSASKRCQEQRLLMEQLEELRASECALRVRVQSLTSELALLRKGRVTPLSGRTSSRADGNFYRSLSRERPASRTVRARSGSRESMCDRRQQSNDRRRRSGSSGPCARISQQSPSPTRIQVPRFDPTAYIQDRQRRQEAAEVKKQKKVRQDLSSPSMPERGRLRSREVYPLRTRSGSRGRSLSSERQGSRLSSESLMGGSTEIDKTMFRRRKQTYCYNGSSESRGGRVIRKPLCSTPTQRIKEKENSVDKGSELSEIDARLQALQDYMRNLDTAP